MSNIILKKSSIANRIPLVGDLQYGEFAINYTDGKLYYKTSGNVIDYIGSGSLTSANTVTIAQGGTGQTTQTAAINALLPAQVNNIGKFLTTDGTNTSWVTAGAYRVITITDATSITVNCNTTDLAIQTNTQAIGTLTINAPTGTATNGQKFSIRLKSTNVQTFSWNAVFDGSTDLPLPTTSTGYNNYDYLGFMYNADTSQWQILAKNFGF